MKSYPQRFNISRRAVLSTLAVLPALSSPFLPISSRAQSTTSGDPLPSWNDGRAKQVITTFVKETTDQASPKFVSAAERIATFDQDGTLWVEHPIYTQVVYCLDRVPTVVAQKPELIPIPDLLESNGCRLSIPWTTSLARHFWYDSVMTI
jgi:hypothetical protein